jgi:hypothetical protein
MPIPSTATQSPLRMLNLGTTAIAFAGAPPGPVRTGWIDGLGLRLARGEHDHNRREPNSEQA